MYVEYGYQAENQDEVALNDLMRTNSFSEADLKENRAGRISSPQLMRLCLKAVVPFLAMGVPLLGLVVMIVMFAQIAPFLTAKLSFLLKFGQYVTAFLGAIVFGLIALLINFILHSERLLLLVLDMAAGKAGSEAGRLNTSKAEEIEDGINTVLRNKTTTLNYVVKGQNYQVSEAAYDAMVDSSGSIFRVYFTPKSRYLLSIEPARPESPN